MKLSMWIIADWLNSYNPEINIRDGELDIETVRLFSSGMPEADNCIYIGRTRDLFTTKKNQVICTHKNDILILQTEDLDEIINQVLNAFEYYQSWNTRILEAISTDRRPADILKIVNEVIKEPIYMLDASQYAMALSEEFGSGEVNELWDQMLIHNTANISFLSKLDSEYPEHRTNRGLYYFNAPFIDLHSYNYNMFLKDQWLGLCSMIERGTALSRSVIDLFHLICTDIELWFISHSQEKESMMLDAMFREMLIGASASEAFRRQYQLRFGSTNDKKYILVLASQKEQALLISHLCRELNLMFPDTISIIYQQYICILLNCRLSSPDNFIKKLRPVMKRNNYYSGISTEFIDLDQIEAHFNEALYAVNIMKPLPGACVQFSDYALKYALEKISSEMPEGSIHPDVEGLIEYDRSHNTEFAHTFQVYLENERSQSRTAAVLNLHRNTLTYRLSRIRELIRADLDDPDERLHMIISFRVRS